MLCFMTRFTNIYSLVPTSDLDQNFHLWVMQELRDLVLMMWLLNIQSLLQVTPEKTAESSQQLKIWE